VAELEGRLVAAHGRSLLRHALRFVIWR
jgi:hypothetical protein